MRESYSSERGGGKRNVRVKGEGMRDLVTLGLCGWSQRCVVVVVVGALNRVREL